MFSLALLNGLVIDGSGSPGRRADLYINGDAIALISPERLTAAASIDCSGLILAPGFIDIHSHSDLYLLNSPEVNVKLAQGITTEVNGLCGLGVFPVAEGDRRVVHDLYRGVWGELEGEWDWLDFKGYKKRLKAALPSVNVAPLCGYGMIRNLIAGMDKRPLSAAETARALELINGLFDEGLFGVSFGMAYPPCAYASDPELISVCGAVGDRGGFISFHIWDEGNMAVESVSRAIGFAEASGVSLEISHFKTYGRGNWHKTGELLRLVDEARARGLKVDLDQYPYLAGSTTLNAILPPWAFEGGIKEILKKLSNPAVKEKIIKDMETGIPGWENYGKTTGWENVSIMNLGRTPEFEGRSLVDIAGAMGMSPARASVELIRAEKGGASMIMRGMSDESVKEIMKSPRMCVGSDSLFSGKYHPRTAGTFPRFLSAYVRDRQVMPLSEALKKTSYNAALKAGLSERGLLKEGFKADIVAFSLDRLADNATFEDPFRRPSGIEHVIVNGLPAYSGGREVNKNGKVLEKQ